MVMAVVVVVFFPFRIFEERHIGRDVRAARRHLVDVELLQGPGLVEATLQLRVLVRRDQRQQGLSSPVAIAWSAATTLGSSAVPVGLMPS